MHTPNTLLSNCMLQVQETFEVAEMERTIEDMIEEQRAKLHAEGKQVYYEVDICGVHPLELPLQIVHIRAQH
jgi:hypothetical protein